MNRLPAIFTVLALGACGTTPATTHEDDSTHAHEPDATTTPDVVAPGPADMAAADKADLYQAELAAYDAAKPVFAKYCASCHAEGGASATERKREHLDVTSYPFASAHLVALTATLRHVVGLDGARPSMPPNNRGGVADADLARIAAWADAYDAADEGGAHLGRAGYPKPGDVDAPDND